MAIKSMSGFGSASAHAEGVRVSVELSSVNRKQLDVVFRLPPQLGALEPQLQKAVQQKISRGRIQAAVQLDLTGGESPVQIDEQRAKAVVGRLRRAAGKLGLADDLRASMLLQIPGLLNMQETGPGSDGAGPLAEKALQAALKKLDAMRSREGKALEADLRKRLKELEKILTQIKARAPGIVQNYSRRLAQALEKAGLKEALRDERVLREVALFAERSDISEEITRLESHLTQFRTLMRGGEPAGRPLDFLAQECFREINTIGSKANDLEVTQQVLAFKTGLERIREQIQNVE